MMEWKGERKRERERNGEMAKGREEGKDKRLVEMNRPHTHTHTPD